VLHVLSLRLGGRDRANLGSLQKRLVRGRYLNADSDPARCCECAHVGRGTKHEYSVPRCRGVPWRVPACRPPLVCCLVESQCNARQGMQSRGRVNRGSGCGRWQAYHTRRASRESGKRAVVTLTLIHQYQPLKCRIRVTVGADNGNWAETGRCGLWLCVVCGVWCVDVDVSATEWIEIRDSRLETQELSPRSCRKEKWRNCRLPPCLVELVCERARSMQAQQEPPARTEEGWNHPRGIVYPNAKRPSLGRAKSCLGQLRSSPAPLVCDCSSSFLLPVPPARATESERPRFLWEGCRRALRSNEPGRGTLEPFDWLRGRGSCLLGCSHCGSCGTCFGVLGAACGRPKPSESEVRARTGTSESQRARVSPNEPSAENAKQARRVNSAPQLAPPVPWLSRRWCLGRCERESLRNY
jgi:hypothetical protein